MKDDVRIHYLHKEASDKSFSYVDIIIFTVEVCAPTGQVETIHNTYKLVPHAVSGLERTILHEVIVTPLRFFVIYTGNDNALYLYLPHIPN